MMDGQFVSLYPYIKNQEQLDSGNHRWTLTHVTHTPQGKYTRLDEAMAAMERIDDSAVEALVPKFEETAKLYMPKFHERFVRVGHFTSMKTKEVATDATAARSSRVEVNGRVITVISGKVNTIFQVERATLCHMFEQIEQF